MTVVESEAFVGRKNIGEDPILTFHEDAIYQGRKHWGDPIATVVEDAVYQGRKHWGDPVATIVGNEVYAGKKNWGEDPIATVVDGGRMSAACAAVYLLLM